MRIFLRIALFFFLLSLSSPRVAAAPGGFAVLELFTSEGCPACPPADYFFGEAVHFAEENDSLPVFALAWHVDYWNRPDWRDPYSRREFSQRQERYVRRLGSDLYTPQLIVNGVTQFNGADLERMVAEVREAISFGSPSFELSLDSMTVLGDTLVVNLFLTDSPLLLTVALVEQDIPHSSDPGNRDIRHANVVRDFFFGPVRGPVLVTLDLKKATDRKRLRVIAFAQDPRTYETLSAARRRVE